MLRKTLIWLMIAATAIGLGGSEAMAQPLQALTVIVPAAGDRPTTFRQRTGAGGIGRDVFAGLEADAAEVLQDVGPNWVGGYLTGGIEMPSGDWFLFVGGTGAKRTGPNTWSDWGAYLYTPAGLNVLYAHTPNLMRGGTDMVALGRDNFHMVSVPDPNPIPPPWGGTWPPIVLPEYDLVALAWKWDGTGHPDNTGDADLVRSVLQVGNAAGPAYAQFETPVPGAIWQDPSGRTVALYPVGRYAPGQWALGSADFYIRAGDIYSDTWSAPVQVAAAAQGASMGYRGSSYQALPLEPDRSVLVAYLVTDESAVGYPPGNLWVCTRLLTWTGLTFTLGPQVVAFGPFAASTSTPVEYLMIGGLWQDASGVVSLFFGEHVSGALHLLTSADRGTTWH